MTQIENAGLEKLNERGLNASLLTACFEASRDGLVLVDSSGQILAANHAFINLLGHNTESVLQNNWLNLFKTAQRIRAEDTLADLVNGKPGLLKHTRMLTADNRLVPVRIWGQLLEGCDQPYVLMTTQDLDTESEQTGFKLPCFHMT